MELIPKPEQVVSAAVDVARRMLCGGHLGLLTVRAAGRAPRAVIDRWVPRQSSKQAVRRPPGRGTASRAAIGANPDRRYGSAASRTLARE